MSNRQTLFLTGLLLMVIPSVVYADMVWPALYTETKLSSVPIILLSLVIEFFFYKWLFEINVKKSVYYTVLANSVSGVLGLVLRPLSGILYELSLGAIVNLIFNWGTFNPVAWFFVPVIGGAVNAFVELEVIRMVWKHPLDRRNYYLTWGMNALTVAIATAWVIISPPSV